MIFFDAKKIPFITFNSTNISEKNILTGDLTIAGVTQTVSFPVNVTPTQNQDYIVSGKLSLNRMDYGIKKHKRMVGKNVDINLSIYLKPSSELENK